MHHQGPSARPRPAVGQEHVRMSDPTGGIEHSREWEFAIVAQSQVGKTSPEASEAGERSSV